VKTENIKLEHPLDHNLHLKTLVLNNHFGFTKSMLEHPLDQSSSLKH
jgi:hypothetical protein